MRKNDYYIVDTNVCKAANFQVADLECVRACIIALLDIIRNRKIVLDSDNCILSEYLKHVTRSGGGVGDHFILWVADHQADINICELVSPIKGEHTCADYEKFPLGSSLKKFDRSDRKFVAAAISSNNSPVVYNATDGRSWWKYRKQLAALKLNIHHLCPQLMKKP